MSDEGKVTTERREHVLLIGLDRAAKRNAFDLPLCHALCQAYTELETRRRSALRRALRAWRPLHRRASICCSGRRSSPRAASRSPKATIDPLGLGLGAPG